MNTRTKLITLLLTILLWVGLMPLKAVAATTTGDVNNDGEVNIADVNAVIDVILSGYSVSSADVNHDGEINIADINTIIDIILGGSVPTPSGIETITVNGVSFNMVNVEGGTFTMGAADDDTEAFDSDRPAHQVTLSSYSIGQTEVTQALWLAVMGSNPSYFTSANGFTDDLNRPVEMVSWDDCQEFITKLNQMTGKTFRLPTEAEWEYAARGGNKSYGYKYAGSNTLDDVAWYRDNAYSVGSNSPDYGTHAVATKYPNELGLYDMSGNVGEWCQDWWNIYSNDAQTNPFGPTLGATRLYRGGCWGNIARYCRVSIRRGMVPTNSNQPLGLRLVSDSEMDIDNGHGYVDLGLPSGTLWATCNVGASIPEEYGDYFAWGETAPKETYDWGSYKWGNYRMTKYVTDNQYGTVDYKTELEPEDDAACVNWGLPWRMPSSEQQMELFNECTWTWTTLNGVNGFMVTGPNQNTLFLPATGCYEGSSLYSDGVNGEYWSRTLRTNLAQYARTILFYNYYGGVNLYESTRERGLSVRAVRVSSDDIFIEQQSLDLGVVPIGEMRTGELAIVNCSDKAMTLTATADAPFSFKQEEGDASSMTIVVPGNTRDTVTVLFTATTEGEFSGNVIFQNPALNGGESVIPVQVRAFTDDFPQHEYVDLGLPSGTLWATMNVGANDPEEYGNYFAWGETAPKEVYTWETYKWCNGNYNSLSKYCLDSYYGQVDHKFELEPADDAAYMNWGPSWRTPTVEQLTELTQCCTWQWTTINGVRGQLGTGPNGNSLFLPAAGRYEGESLCYTGSSFGWYWSRMLNGVGSNSAFCKDFSGGRNSNRNYGISVRAVRVSEE